MSPRPTRPVGTITRGTTAPNRLRRVDRWTVATAARALRAADDPLVVDLGFGATPTTTLELHRSLCSVRPDIQVVGVEIDPDRVATARLARRPGVDFVQGGFELGADPLLAGRRPVVIRAFNVLRQYDEDEVGSAWDRLTTRIAPGGLVVEGTCDEPGRLATWVRLGPEGPLSLTLAARLSGLQRPGVLAERLPKALIHRNVAGEPIHAFLSDLDRAWDRAAPLGSYGARQRWAAAIGEVGTHWPLVDQSGRARSGEVTVTWSAVAPVG